MVLIIIFLFSFSAFSAHDLDQLANSSKWLKLLHYKKTLAGNYESQADGMDFFLHPQGKWKPLAELQKSIELFSSNNFPTDQDAACKFPARLRWLNNQLRNPWEINLTGCKKYIEFFSKLAAKRASIVFSSYYLSNPNSAFGHTFIRLSRYDDREETEMLDYGINYSAEANATNPFIYAYKGLFGGYKGKFTAMPYYYKVREYSDFEFRDLWSYELNLSMPQVMEMVDHIWELGHTDFDYFYFLENCSYHLLSILEVVMPEKDLTDNYSLFAIPADTIRLLRQEGLIGEGKRRESTYSRLTRLSQNVKSDSLKKARVIVENPTSTSQKIEGMDEKISADILDIAMEGFDYLNSENILLDDPATLEAKSHILKARAINPVITADVQVQSLFKNSPAESHAPTRYALAQSYFSGEGRNTLFEIRPALHDLLDPPRGSLKEAQLEMGKFSLNYKEKKYESENLILQELTVLSLKNYPTQSFWAKPFSWEIEVGIRQLDRFDCFDCPAPRISGSFGSNLLPINQKVLISFLLNGEFNFHNYFTDSYRMGLGPKIVSRFTFSEKWLMGCNIQYHFNTYQTSRPMQDHELSGVLELRHHVARDFSLFVQVLGIERDNEWRRQGVFGLQYFH
jgi:hypothetical protein